MTESAVSDSEPVDPSLERSRYRRVQLVASAVLLVTFAAGSALQANLLGAVGVDVAPETTAQVGERLLANLGASAAVLLLLGAAPSFGLPWPAKVLGLMAIGLAGGIVRAILQLVLAVHATARWDLLLLDSLAPAVTVAVSLAGGLGAAEAVDALRRRERLNAQQSLRAAQALQQLQAEELRVRRVVAEGLHGTLQQQLVLIAAQLRALRERAQPGAVLGDDDVRLLSALHDEIESLREQDVRGYSQLLFPSGVGMGIAQAVRVLFRRLSSAIAVSVRIDDTVVRVDDPGRDPLPVPFRILAIRILEEGVANALRHGQALTLQAQVLIDSHGRLELTLDDDGSGVGSGETLALSGLARLRERVEEEGGFLEIGPSSLGGARLRAVLPLPAPAT